MIALGVLRPSPSHMTAQWHLASRHRFGQCLCWLLVLLSVLVQWCAPCEDLPSQDGGAWQAVNDQSFSCSDDYGDDPVSYCANYGSDAGEYGLTGTEACCLCDGGLTTAAPSQVGETGADGYKWQQFIWDDE